MYQLHELAAVNALLGTLGELPLNSIDDDHPLVPAAQAILMNCVQNVQVRRWWYNVEYINLFPDPLTKHINVPTDTASVDSLTAKPRIGLRGTRLFDLDAGTDIFERPVRVRLHRCLAFEDCPLSVRMYILAMAKRKFHAAHDGDQTKMQALAAEEGESYAHMHSEHIRNAKANMLERSTVQRMVHAISPQRTYR